MMKRLFTALFLSIVLSVGLVPTVALAADGNLAAGKAGPTTAALSMQASERITVSPSTSYLGTGLKAKIKAIFGKTYMGSVSSSFIWNASYYGRFTVLKGGKVLKTGKVGLSVGGDYDYAWYEGSYNYKPKAVGTYKVRFSFMDGTTEMESYETTLEVKEVTALKSYKPTFSVEEDEVGTDMSFKLSGLNGKTQIYRARSKKGEYKLITTTTKATYTDKEAKAGKEYWYKTRVIGKAGSKTYKSKLSAAKTNTLLYGAPNVPTIKSAAATSEGVQLKWNKTPRAAAPYGCYYYIQRSTKKDGGYEQIASIRQDNDGTLDLFDGEGELPSNSAYLDTTAEPGQTYYYKVCAKYEFKWAPNAHSDSAPVSVIA